MKTATYDAIEQAALAGALVLKEVLENRDTSDEQLALGRMGSSAISSLAKLYQANSAREATVASILTHASPDADEFRRLVIAALPGSNVGMALAEPVKRSDAPRSKARPRRAKQG